MSRLLNRSKDDIRIPSGKIVGAYQQVTLVNPSDYAQYDTDPGAAETEDEVILLNRLEVKDQVPMESTPIPEHLKEHMAQWCAGLSQSEQREVEELLTRYSDVFATGPLDVGCTSLVKHSIHLKDKTTPIKQRPYRQGPAKEAEIDRHVKEMLHQGLIKPGSGEWSSPTILVPKKSGETRMVIDYRRINAVTVKDSYPLPRIDDSLDCLGKSKIFSSLDLVSGYWQIEMDKEARERAAFVTRGGLWEPQRLAFGLVNAPGTFERLMETVMRGLQYTTLLVYMDDILCFAPDMETHLGRLEEIFRRLRAANLKLKPSKCRLFRRKVQYLGHVVSEEGVSTDPVKTEAVQEWPRPQHPRDVRAFLGTTGYYRRFILNYAEMSRPLTHLTGKNIPFDWTDDCHRAFEQLKTALTSSLRRF